MAGENINRRLNIYINDREIVNSSRGIKAEMRKVLNEINNLNEGADDYNEKLKTLSDTYKKLQVEQAKFKSRLAETPGILQKIKSSLGPIAVGMLAAFSVQSLVSGFVSKMKDAWKIVVEFDQKQANLAAIMGKTRLQVAGLTADAIKYGASTAYSASGVTGLQIELAKLGKTAPEIRAMTKDVLNAATALETDLASAAVLVGGQLNAFGERADKAGKFADIMANNTNVSAASYEYLAGSLPKVSSVAAQADVTFERLNATVGVLADQNIAAETAGTGFRNILLESAKAGRPYQEMLDQIKNSANQSKTAVDLFGKENATVAVILANSTDKINEQTKALENSIGSSEKLAKEKMNSIKGAAESFSGAWEGFILSIEKGDGIISRTIRGLINMGTAILGALSPMEQLSDQIEKEQLGLNVLVSKITSTNTSNEERKSLLMELKREYPDFIKNIDIENISNGELSESLNKINEQYVKRIALQRIVEKLEKAQGQQANWMAQQVEQQNKIFEKLNAIKGQFALKVNIDFNDLDKSAAEMRKELQKKDLGTSRMNSIESDLDMLNRITAGMNRSASEVKHRTEEVDRSSKALGINTEAQNEQNKALAAAAEEMKKLREEARKLGMKNVDTSTDEQVRIWLNAMHEKNKIQDEESEKEKKKRLKAIEDAKKHSEDLLKAAEASQKELLETKRNFEDIDLGNQKESYQKERDLLNLEYDRKIEDLKIKIAEEQKEIDKLRTDLKDPKNSKKDRQVIQSQIDDKLEIQKIYNSSSVALENTRMLKISALQEKYLNKDIEAAEKANQKSLKQLQSRHSAELLQLNTLDEAKAVLQNYLSDEEISKIKTLEKAKTRIKEEQLKEQFELQKTYLLDMVAQIQSILAAETASGIVMISDEQRAKLFEFLDTAAEKLNVIRQGGENVETADPSKDIKSLSGIDILGFSPEQWETTFASLDTFGQKMAAVELGVGAMKSAFGMYFQFMEIGENRSLQKFEASNRKKQKELTNLLDKGYITQEQYNARKEKLDIDLAKKKAELEYKQAKRQKAMNIAMIIADTAVGVGKALAQGGFIFGVPWAAIIGAMGALQLAAAIAQPLPDKNGFYDGGYTGDGNSRSEAGPVHRREYVVPEKVLFSNDPVVPNVIGYLEGKRKGNQPEVDFPEDRPQHGAVFGDVASNQEILYHLRRQTDILEKLEADGFTGFLVNDIKAARLMRDKIKELENLEKSIKL